MMRVNRPAMPKKWHQDEKNGHLGLAVAGSESSAGARRESRFAKEADPRLLRGYRTQGLIGGVGDAVDVNAAFFAFDVGKSQVHTGDLVFDLFIDLFVDENLVIILLGKPFQA